MSPTDGRGAASDATGGTSHAPAIDHQKLLAEIDAEVQRKRESGDIPADLERELDLVFARFAPVDALEADFEQVLTRAEQATFIDVIAPVESSRPVVPIFKKVVRKVVGWYLRYVAQQTSAFAHAITRAVRLLGERVDVLEQASPVAAQRAAADGDVQPPSAPDLSHWAPTLARWLQATTGRVLHAEAGDGALLAALVEAGVDAYGVDPRPRPNVVNEVREDEAAVHLRALPDGALAAIVLSGCVDRMALGAQLQLADLVATKVAPGGTVIVLGTHPAAWAESHAPVHVDLSPGRPLHPETWQHLLAQRGMTESEIVTGPPDRAALAPVPKGDRVLNANIERLNALLFGPSSYALAAHRPE
ncbi:MAG: hypothetical protein QOI20_1046 [Acidimicrobiaceae bacterium]|jgi:hypothetical protein|nr:hypothetical protein [Acidimicrobiaceae bacterium]